VAWIGLVVACGSSQDTSTDAGAEASSGAHPVCVADFPCFRPWSCVDATHWIAQETQSCETVCPTPCDGATCASVGDAQACPAGTSCIDPQSTAADYAGPFCAVGGAAGCAPAEESSFVPQPTTAPPRQVGVCTNVAVEQFWSRCVDPSTADANACAYWEGQYAACEACLGPMFEYVPFTSQGFVASFQNVSGCYATLDGTVAPGSCAALEDANLQCAIASCSSVCSTDEATFDACIALARTTTCSAFPRCDADAGASYAACSGSSPGVFYVTFGEALCGP
jgi:hypothetical protein